MSLLCIDQVRNLLLLGNVLIEAFTPLEFKWIYQVNFCCELFAQLQRQMFYNRGNTSFLQGASSRQTAIHLEKGLK